MNKKEVKIDFETFANIQKLVKSSVATDIARPVLKKIYLQVDEEFISFESCDGCSAVLQKIEHKQENVEPFTALFYPIDFPKNIKEGYLVFLKEDNILKVKIKSDKFDVEYKFVQLVEDFVKLDSVIKPHGKFKIAFTPAYLCKLLKNMGKVCYFIIPEKNTEPLYVQNENKTAEAVLLPVRYYEK